MNLQSGVFMQSTIYSYSLPGSSENIIDRGSSASLGSPSSPSHFYSTPNTHKRRKIDRACDACRRRKTKCDGPKTQDNVCTNCLLTKKSCTYVEVSKPRGPPKAYITGLEDRMEKLEALLNELRPDVDFSFELGPPVIRGSWKIQDSVLTSPFEHQRHPTSSGSSWPTAASQTFGNTVTLTPSQSAPLRHTTHLIFDSQPSYRRLRSRPDQPFSGEDTDNESQSEDSGESETLEIESLTGLMKKLTLRGIDSNPDIPAHQNPRFHGNCSPVGLVEATRQFKLMHLLETKKNSRLPTAPQPDMSGSPIGGLTLRHEIWSTPKWEHHLEHHGLESTDLISSALAEFPPTDLADDLINLYFRYTNSIFSVLHHATFARQWREKLHHKNIWFATLCLFLFGAASRWTDDPRVIKEGAKTTLSDHDWRYPGLGYFEKAVEIYRAVQSTFYPASLLEIQSLTLMALYLHATDNYPASWIVVSVAIRKAQDVGAHRKNVYRSSPTVDGELWKRTFWCLIVLDRLVSVILGRGCGVGEEDFDVDLPLEVDDQYWETDDPALAFRQPAGIPCKVSAFTWVIKLTQITAFALRTLYAIDQSKVFSGLKFVNWREEVFEQLNAALSEWAASVPNHLLWPPPKENLLFTAQAAALWMLYYTVRILIYRPFISFSTGAPYSPSENDASSFPYPAMEICVEAARSCARIVEAVAERGLSNVPALMNIAHISATMLLVKVWDLKAQDKSLQAQGIEDLKPPVVQQIEPFMADVNMLIHVLERAQFRWGFVSSFLHQLRESLPDSDDQSSLNTDGSSYSTHPSPATPPPQYIPAQFPTTEGEPPLLNQLWQRQSHPVKIQPTRSAHSARPLPVQALSQHLDPHAQYNHGLLGFITQEHTSLSRPVEERYETQQDQTMETVSWPPPSQRTIGTSDVPKSFAPVDRPVSYVSSATRKTTFSAHQGGNEPGDSGNHRPICPNPRTAEPGSLSSHFNLSFP